METLNDTLGSKGEEDDDDKRLIYILQGLVVSIFAVLIICTNILNLIIIPRLPDINEASKVFYNCLSSADILLGVVILPALPSAIVGDWPFGDVVCKIFGFGLTLVAGLSSASLLLLNLDRFFSIASPLRYMAIMDRRKAVVIATSAVITEATFLLIILFLNPLGPGIIQHSKLGACIMSFNEPSFIAYSLAIFSLFIWSFLPILAIIYARIICISKRHVRRIQVQEFTPRISRVAESDEPGLPDERSPAARKNVNHKAIRMTLLVTGTYVVAWAPFTICQIYVAMVTDDVSIIIRALVCWPLLLNPLCNVIIYSVTKRSYRVLARNLLKGFLRCSLADLRKATSHDILV
ncbi:beta-3 adrenergic receptor-like [Strongylocentrotus purpuratus]|uniref:G-protein coupled receptors family 1 profile domain-containing protein n=1 Tax=Strongylocentrotus purpuratus TaxID=7668 RepID=A0A7M7RFK7_STRPU|nr:beta-3 adrenergic receptor-like [Strongylocentrotus purpuratus]|eukprot:XP_790572.1 PREDICTED: beta-3 adrenergic receptor-like [Strongylocentrotus purpuratus]